MIELAIAVGLIALGYFYGSAIEKKHFAELRIKEEKLAFLPWKSSGKKETFSEESSTIVLGSVVIAQDRFKNFMAKLLSLFGGRITVYETLLDRARREALVRMRNEATRWNAKEIVNVRIETSDVSGNEGAKRQPGVIEVLAYGTAIK